MSGEAAKTRGYKGPISMEGVIAKWYVGNAKKNLAQYKMWATMIRQRVAPDSRVLEVAPGPGFLAIELAKLGNYKITGLDISKTFVQIEQKNAREAGLEIDFRLGDAGHMPFESELFDFIVCTAAFKNFSEPINALNEMYRVLKPDGKALIIDMRRDASKESIEKAVKAMPLDRVNSLFTKWTLSWLSKRAMTKEEFVELVSKTSFGECTIEEEGIGLEVNLQKWSAPQISE